MSLLLTSFAPCLSQNAFVFVSRYVGIDSYHRENYTAAGTTALSAPKSTKLLFIYLILGVNKIIKFLCSSSNLCVICFKSLCANEFSRQTFMP